MKDYLNYSYTTYQERKKHKPTSYTNIVSIVFDFDEANRMKREIPVHTVAL